MNTCIHEALSSYWLTSLDTCVTGAVTECKVMVEGVVVMVRGRRECEGRGGGRKKV